MNNRTIDDLSHQEKIMLINARRMIDSVSKSIMTNDIELISNISKLNSSIEILMFLLDSTHNLNINPHSRFSEVWKKLEKDLFNNLTNNIFSYTQLDSINKQRNLALHRGIPPNPNQITSWIQVCNDFYEYVCDLIFGEQVLLTESALLSIDFWKSKFAKIEELYQKKEMKSFFEEAHNLLQYIDDFILTRNLSSLVLCHLNFDDIEYSIHKLNHLRLNANDYGIEYNHLLRLSLESIFNAELMEVRSKDSLKTTWQGQEIDLAEILKESTSNEEIENLFHKIYSFLWEIMFVSGIGNSKPFISYFETLLKTASEEEKVSIYPLFYSKGGFNYYYGYVNSKQDFLESLKNKEVEFLNVFGASMKYVVDDIFYIESNTKEFVVFIMQVKRVFKKLKLK